MTIQRLLLASVLVHGDVIERVIARVNSQIVTLSEFEARQMAAIQAARVPDSEVEAFLRQGRSASPLTFFVSGIAQKRHPGLPVVESAPL